MYASPCLNLHESIIPAQSSKLISAPTDIEQGDIIVDQQILCNCHISSCLTTAKNNQAKLEVINPTDNDIIFSLSEPIHASIFNEQIAPVTKPDTCNNKARTREVLSRLRIDHLNAEEAINLTKLCAEYSDVFYLEDEPLTFTNRIKHSINTTDELPVYSKTYRYPYIHREEVQRQIKKMLDQGIIRPSTSAWSAPIWVVPKKSDASGKTKWRLVIDFRKLNEKTIDDKYPIPNITDTLDKLGKCQYFVSLDLTSGFYQVELDPKDIHKTAFNVEQGHYEFLRMPMGLKNSPSTFQRVMDNVLRGLLNKICVVYLDDILVFGTSLQEIICNLRSVFQRLRESNFKIQMDKSEFLKRETPYLGHIITPEGVKPNPEKISAIVNYPLPKTTKQIKSFLGLLGYYRKFIPDYARITKFLTANLKKGAKINITPDYISNFEHCKTLLTNDPILQYPDFTKEFILTTDASKYALGAVLSQGTIGSDRPISYASRTLNSSEINYSTIEKELLAIVWATKYFRPYLFGRKFKIVTDHKPLQWLMNLKEPNSRLTRFRLKLAEYNFTVIYKKGSCNTNADALSRIEIHNDETISLLVNTSETSERRHSSSSTLTASETIDNVTESHERRSSSSTLTAPEIIATETVHTNVENPILEIPISDDPLNKYRRQIIVNIVNKPPRTKPKVTKPFDTYLQVDTEVCVGPNFDQNIVDIIKKHVDPKICTAILVNPIDKMYEIVPIIQRAFKNSSMKLFLVKKQIVNMSDFSSQQDIIRKYHEGKTNHRGINETYLALSAQYFWPKMKNDITKYINECVICGCAKYDRNPIRQQFRIVPPPTKPFEIIHADVLTLEQEKYLTLIDSFSKYAQAYRMVDCTAPNIVKSLLKFSTHHGYPMTLVTDQGTEFTNQVVSEFLRLHKIQHRTTAAHAPNENGMIERFHSTLIEHLRILKLQHKNESAANLVSYALLAYNSSIHNLTKCRPFDLITGHFDPRDPTDTNITERLLQQYVQDHRSRMQTVYRLVHESSLAERESLMTRRNENREPEIEYTPNQEIFIRNPLASRQKLASRFTSDKVIADLPIHIYTSKKRGPVAKTRLKRPKKNTRHTLLQVPPDNNDEPDLSSSSRDPA
ncbi:retrovirus-related Pol polyprotein from transposon 297 [Helicoverpa armigera]|uniref:retrovirus-related Pol polyprotein from transposon 297 n=1 Tax=Helicoverpa armigera TaxID=29058 RepID=UPI003083144B